ncbi:MAG: hypothetical protein PVJ33_01380 [Lysobacterales bacterium]|jgi:hypothetical protein
MRVFSPRIAEEGGEIRVSARVEVDSARTRLPAEIWFSFPTSCKDHVSDHLNGFAVALLPLAMTLGEDIHLEGTLSPHLLRGIRDYQRIQCAWKPGAFKSVNIFQGHLQATEIGPAGPGVGCSFSGGIDSFHTLWRHLPENEPIPKYRISHCLMINGFDADSDIENNNHFSAIRRSIKPMMANHNLKLIVCRTNYMSFSDPSILKQSFGAMVTAPALILGRLFSCFYVPSSYRFDEFFRDGSHLLLDHLVSTESMETIHDSSHLNRPEKTAILSNWSETYSRLRVCFNKTGFDEHAGSIVNCGRCEKCIRTMKTLEILNSLDKYTTFTRVPSHFNVWMCNYGSRGARIHAREIMSLAWKAGRKGIWFDYCVAIAVSLIFKAPRALARRLHLFLEERSERYAVNIRRLFPRLRRRAYWIK